MPRLACDTARFCPYRRVRLRARNRAQPGETIPGRHPWARRKKVYEGKAKILYEGPEPGTLVQYFKDDATAFNAGKSARRSRARAC